jgi:tetratricopeptide (TPR) repeat protein
LDESEAWALSHHLEGHLCAAEINRGDLWNRMGKTDLAIVSYRRALEYADHLSFWRGFTSTGGSLAKALASEGHLEEALQIIDRTLNANTHIPDELYFVPRNLAVKAEILRRMGRISDSNDNYKRSTTLIDSLLTQFSALWDGKNIVREVTAPELKQFVPLPQSLHEVTTIAQDFPKPSVVLSGDAAT